MESYNLISGLRGYEQSGGSFTDVVKIALKRDYPRLSKWYAQSKHKTSVGRERELPLSEAEERGSGRAMARGRGAVGRVRVTKTTQTHGLHFKDGTA